ncbi:hypothetical protein BLA29_013940, partial [Euroglyphus maynei]
IKPNFYTTQFFTGHGHFLQYLHRIQRSDTYSCTCTQDATQDPTHLLLHCTNYTDIKHILNLQNINTLHDFVHNKNTYTKFKTLCKHIHTELVNTHFHYTS